MKKLLILILATISFSLQAQTWLEEPAHSDTTATYVTVRMTHEGTPFRSFTYCYDSDKRISLWVAYPLNANLIGTGSRGDGWLPSPDIPLEKQAILYKGFRPGHYDLIRYDRGHQIPSADRLTPEANAQTFIFPNATPQEHDFNSGIWTDLEKLVRTWAKRSDTLYVVTGVVPGTKTVKDNEGNDVNVPFAYYKTVLRKNTDKYGRLHWSACAVLLLHSDNHEGTWPENLQFLKERSFPVDELEKITGQTYFPLAEKFIGKDEWNRLRTTPPDQEPWWWK